MISVYDSKATDFTKNGLVVLNDCIKAEITEEVNGLFELELEYPLDDKSKFEDLVEDNIIKADGQLFRIYYKFTTLFSRKVNARHIFYDNIDNTTEEVTLTNVTGQGATDYLLKHTQYAHEFTSSGNLTATATVKISNENVVENIMGQAGIIALYGGELVRDNFDIKLLKARGSDKGVLISYGKNIRGIEEKLDLDSVATRLDVTAIVQNGLKITLPERYIDSPYINNYSHPKIRAIEFPKEQMPVGYTITPEVTAAIAVYKACSVVNNTSYSNNIASMKIVVGNCAKSILTGTRKTTMKAEWNKIVAEKSINDTAANKWFKQPIGALNTIEDLVAGYPLGNTNVYSIRNLDQENGEKWYYFNHWSWVSCYMCATQQAEYATAYANLSAYLTPLFANMSVTSNVDQTTFKNRFKSYYDARSALLTVNFNKSAEALYVVRYIAEKNLCITTLRRLANDYFVLSGCDVVQPNYKVDFLELSKTEEYKNYAILETVSLGDIVSVRHNKLNMTLKAEVIKTTKNIITNRIEKIELGNLKKTLSSDFDDNARNIQSIISRLRSLESGSARVVNGVISNANIDLSNIDNLLGIFNSIGDLDSKTDIYVDSITANLAEVDTIVAQTITTVDLHTTNLDAINGSITNLTSDNIEVRNLVANAIVTVDLHTTNLTSINGEITNLNSDIINVNLLLADAATIVELDATNIRTTTLEAQTALINTLVAGNIGAANIAAGTIVAGSTIIAEGAIGSAQILNLDAGKLNAGTVDTSKVTIQGSNGRLKITGNRLQVFAGTTTLYERVSLGDVNGDGTVYGFRVRGADGTTILFDETGVREEGITDGAITNVKISDTAAIDGTKLDIASVVTEINDGIETISSSKIFLNDTTLDLAFGTLSTSVSGQATTISSHTTSIAANLTAIGLKVATLTYTAKMTLLDGINTTNTNTLSSHSSAIDLLEDEIALKVESVDITNAVNAVQIGGRNFILDSNSVYLNPNSPGYGDSVRMTDESPNYYRTTAAVVISTYDSSRIYNNPLLVIGNTYTISAEVRINVAKQVSFWNGIGLSAANIPANVWTKISYTFVQTLNLRVGGFKYEGTQLDYRNLKLEDGTKATAWSPAPEDAINYVDTLKVGGRNLLKKSNEFILSGSDFSTSTTRILGKITVIQDAVWNCYAWAQGSYSLPMSEMCGIVNTEYTISADIKVTGVITGVVELSVDFRTAYTVHSTVVTKGLISPSYSGKWQKIYCTIKNYNTTANNSLISISGPAGCNGAIIEYRNLKFEKGVKASDWTAAPEDVQEQLTISAVGGKNLAFNGDFAKGTTGWSITGITGFTAALGIGSWTVTTQYGGIINPIADFAKYKGHVLYFSVSVKTASNAVYAVLNDGVEQTGSWHSAINQFETLSGIRRIDTAAINLFIKVQDSRTYGWTKTEATNFLVLDLTDIFGVGKEPTIEWCRLNIPWTDGIQAQLNSHLTSITSNTAAIQVNANAIALRVTQLQVDTSIGASKAIPDRRATNETPQWYWTNYPTQVTTEFKQRLTVGAPGTVTYGSLVTTVSWSEPSGGPITQEFKSTDGLFRRISASTTTWEAWQQIENTANAQARVDYLNTNTVVPLTTRVAAAEATILVQAGQIALKVTQSNVDSSIMNLDTMTSLNGTELMSQSFKGGVNDNFYKVLQGAVSFPVITGYSLTKSGVTSHVMAMNGNAWLYTDFIPVNPTNKIWVSGDIYTTLSSTIFVGIEHYDKNKVALATNGDSIYQVQGVKTPSVWHHFEGFDPVRTVGSCAFIKLRLLGNWGSETATVLVGNISAKQLGATQTQQLIPRLSSAESTINIQAGQIALKVESAGVKSIIEQNPNSIKIGFNAINAAQVQIDATGLHVTGGTIDGTRIRQLNGAVIIADLYKNANGGLLDLHDINGLLNVTIGSEAGGGANTGGKMILYWDGLAYPRLEMGIASGAAVINMKGSNANVRIMMYANGTGIQLADVNQNVRTYLTETNGAINNSEIVTSGNYSSYIRNPGRYSAASVYTTIASGTSYYFDHYLGYKPIIRFDGTVGNCMLTTADTDTNQVRIYCFGNPWTGTIYAW